MRVSHPDVTVFDDPNLVAHGGMPEAVRLAQLAGLPSLASEWLVADGVPVPAADVKLMTVVTGMLAGADSIDDLAVVRHGAMPQLVESRAASTIGTWLRSSWLGCATNAERG